MTDPVNGTYTYAYDEASSIVVGGHQLSNNLTSVTVVENGSGVDALPCNPPGHCALLREKGDG
jgi:hypothetical protein